MDDYTIDISEDNIDSVLAEEVRDGNMEEVTTIEGDGTIERAYKLTPKGIEEARALILRLAQENSDA